MADAHRFVATKLWLLVAIVTLPFASLAAIGGSGPLVGAITVVGWFLLTPILLFFGHEIADLVVGDGADSEAAGEASAGGAPDETDAAEDPVETLKERYARGEIDEAEFERTLERLVALDGVEVEDAARDVLVGAEDGGVVEPAADPESPGGDEDYAEDEDHVGREDHAGDEDRAGDGDRAGEPDLERE